MDAKEAEAKVKELEANVAALPDEAKILELAKRERETAEKVLDSRKTETIMDEDNEIRETDSVLLCKAERPAIADFQKLNDDMLIVNRTMNAIRVARGESPQPFQAMKLWKKLENLRAKDGMLKKSLTTTGSGTGSNWIPTIFSTDFFDLMENERLLLKQFQTIPMNSKLMTVRQRTARPTAYVATEASDITVSDPTTASVTATAKKLMAYCKISDEIEEDALIDVVGMEKQDLARTLENAKEEAALNGDVSTNHMDTGRGNAAGDRRKLWNGLRKLALINSLITDCAGAFTEAKLLAAIAAMGEYGMRLEDCIVVPGANGVNAMRLVGGFPSFTTLEKIGNAASAVAGQVGKFYSAAVIPSSYILEDLNASGIYDGTTSTVKTCAHIIRKDAFLVLDRKNVTIESARWIEGGYVKLVASWRGDFIQRYAATVASHWMLYDITKS